MFFKNPNEESNIRRLKIFSKLHSVSNKTYGYSYYIPGGWQGKYRNQIKVSERSLHSQTDLEIQVLAFIGLAVFTV